MGTGKLIWNMKLGKSKWWIDDSEKLRDEQWKQSASAFMLNRIRGTEANQMTADVISVTNGKWNTISIFELPLFHINDRTGIKHVSIQICSNPVGFNEGKSSQKPPLSNRNSFQVDCK